MTKTLASGDVFLTPQKRMVHPVRPAPSYTVQVVTLDMHFSCRPRPSYENTEARGNCDQGRMTLVDDGAEKTEG